MEVREAITMLRDYVIEGKFMPTKKVHQIINLLEELEEYKEKGGNLNE